MCDLSEGIEKRGMAKGIKQGEYQTLYNLLKAGIISINQVVEQLEVSEEEFLAEIKELNIIDTNTN